MSDRGKLKRGTWTFEEDIRLLRYIKLNGPSRWNAVAKASGLQRCAKSCRLRWVNYLRPDLKRGSITPEEERQISNLHAQFGNRWSLIAERIPGRTDNAIKNFWRSHMRKRRPLPSSPFWDGRHIVMRSPESNNPSLSSMENQTNLLNNCTAFLDVPSTPAVSEESTSPSMYERSHEVLNESNIMHNYQVESFLQCEQDEVLSYTFPWPEQDYLMLFMYELYLGIHDMPDSNLYNDITSLPTHTSPAYDLSYSIQDDLEVSDTLWNTFPLLHDQLQMPPPQPKPEILNSHIQR